MNSVKYFGDAEKKTHGLGHQLGTQKGRQRMRLGGWERRGEEEVTAWAKHLGRRK